MCTSPISSVGAKGNLQDWALAALCWQQLAKRNVWSKECSKVTAVQAFEDHITMAKATSIYIHIYSPCKHRQITLRPETEFKGETELFQGKLVEKVRLSTGEAEVKNKWPEFKKERANTINAVKVFSLGKGKISKYMVLFHLKEKGTVPLQKDISILRPPRKSTGSCVHHLKWAAMGKPGYWMHKLHWRSSSHYQVAIAVAY